VAFGVVGCPFCVVGCQLSVVTVSAVLMADNRQPTNRQPTTDNARSDNHRELDVRIVRGVVRRRSVNDRAAAADVDRVRLDMAMSSWRIFASPNSAPECASVSKAFHHEGTKSTKEIFFVSFVSLWFKAFPDLLLALHSPRVRIRFDRAGDGRDSRLDSAGDGR
jgi:hypothetical protein